MLLSAWRLARHASTSAACPWSVLGVKRGASIDTCKSAFRRLALSLHPDVSHNPSDKLRFTAVVEAFETISQGRVGGGARQSGLRGVRSVDGVLLVSIEALQVDPNYDVHSIRVQLSDDDEAEHGAMTRTNEGAVQPASGSEALSTEAVRELHVSAWDSVADVRIMLQQEIELPERLRHGGRQFSERHELIFRGQLLGEHLFLADYGISNGDVLHFACRRSGV